MVPLLWAQAGSTADLDLGGSKLGVVEQECGLRGCLLFENDGGTLGIAFGCDLDAGNLTTGDWLAPIVNLMP